MARDLAPLYRAAAPDSCALSPAGGLNLDCAIVRNHLCAGMQQVSRLYGEAGHTDVAARTRDIAVRDIGCPAW